MYKNNKKYYQNLGYIIDENNPSTLIIKVEDLSKWNALKILCKCNICGIEKYISHSNYNKNISKDNYYACSPMCSGKKRISTNLEKYGVEYAIQSDVFKDKVKQTNLERYGI